MQRDGILNALMPAAAMNSRNRGTNLDTAHEPRARSFQPPPWHKAAHDAGYVEQVVRDGRVSRGTSKEGGRVRLLGRCCRSVLVVGRRSFRERALSGVRDLGK